MRIVPMRHGWLWIRGAFVIVGRKPLLWLLLVMMYWFVLSIAGAIPVLGIVIGLMAVPAFSASFMSAAREIDQGRTPGPLVLASGFREHPLPMAVLGAIYFACCLAVLGLTSLIDGGILIDALRGRRPSAGFETSVATAGVIYLPVMLAFWFAPALVAWERIGAPKALFFSFVASLRNWRALLFYALMLAALAVIVAMSVVIALKMVGAALPGETATPSPRVAAFGLIMFPLMLASSAVLFASWYASYRDVFAPDPDAS